MQVIHKINTGNTEKKRANSSTEYSPEARISLDTTLFFVLLALMTVTHTLHSGKILRLNNIQNILYIRVKLLKKQRDKTNIQSSIIHIIKCLNGHSNWANQINDIAAHKESSRNFQVIQLYICIAVHEFCFQPKKFIWQIDFIYRSINLFFIF